MAGNELESCYVDCTLGKQQMFSAFRHSYGNRSGWMLRFSRVFPQNNADGLVQC